MQDKLLTDITSFYLESADWNGYPLNSLDIDGIIEILVDLVEKDLISLVFADQVSNPHIKLLPPTKISSQIERIKLAEFKLACAYPTPEHLSTVVSKSDYSNRPYTLCLALGEPCLNIKFFDLSVLEAYRNDPRYHYNCNDINGFISAGDSYHQSMPESDSVLLQSFGFAMTTEYSRCVAVVLRYLAKLTPEHQQIWKAKEVKGDYTVHPDYMRTILGEWHEGVSVFTAFLKEEQYINKILTLSGNQVLFVDDSKRPKEFGFLLRPTSKEFFAFVHCLDKLVSENIDRNFFKNKLSLETEDNRKDGKVVVTQKGTLTLLKEYLHKESDSKNTLVIDDAIKSLRSIRTIRQKPAHTLDDNLFDQHYIHAQRDLIAKSYDAIHQVRVVLQEIHQIEDDKIMDSIDASNEIWFF